MAGPLIFSVNIQCNIMNNVARCVLLAASAMILVSVTAYDFRDRAFNQVLARDLEDLYSSLDQPLSNVRHRREADDDEDDDKKCGPPHGHRGMRPLCCGESIFEAMRVAARDSMKACFKEVMEKDADGKPEVRPDPFDCGKHREHMVCSAECEAKKKNLVDADGNPNSEEVTNFVKEMSKDVSWFEPIQEKVISTCLELAKNVSNNHPEDVCNPAAIKMKHCFFREIQLNCPDDKIKDKDACSKLREGLQKHDY